MIASLRRIHRLAAPLAFSAAAIGLVVATRGAGAPHQGDRVVDVSGMDLTTSSDGRFRVGMQAVGASGAGHLWLLPNVPLDAPDLLVYSIDPSSVGAASTDLPMDAMLLGPADSAGPSSVPYLAAPEAVALYSMGHASLVGTLKVGGPDSGLSNGGGN